ETRAGLGRREEAAEAYVAYAEIRRGPRTTRCEGSRHGPQAPVGAGVSGFTSSSGRLGWTLPAMTSSSATLVHFLRLLSTCGIAPRLSCRARLADRTTSRYRFEIRSSAVSSAGNDISVRLLGRSILSSALRRLPAGRATPAPAGRSGSARPR